MNYTMQEVVDQLQKVDTIEEAEQGLYSLIKTGKNYREILKTKFLINGKTVGFNVAKLNEIKAKFEPKLPENNRDPDKATVFSLFKKNKKPTDVVIETRFSFEYVKKSYEEFLEFENEMLVPKYWIDNLEGFASYIRDPSGSNRLGDIHYAFSVAKKSHLELESHVFCCCKCGEEVKIQDNALQAASDYLSQKWGHSECINNT